MSSSNRESEKLLERADEFHGRAIAEIRARQPSDVYLYQKAITEGKFDMDALLPTEMLTWHKNEDQAFLQTYTGRLIFEDLRIFGQSVEENKCVALDVLTRDAVQYAVVRTVEATRGIGRANVGIFGVNTCAINDPNRETINRGLQEIRTLITEENLDDHDIFTKDFLIFPIHRGDEAGCIVILNPSGLLEISEGPNRKECKYLDIATASYGNGDLKDHIRTILNSHRIHHRKGPFRMDDGPLGEDGRLAYDEERLVHLPRLPVEGKYDQQFQLLYILRKLLEQGSNIQEYLEGPVNDLGSDGFEMLREVKKLRVMVLSNISYDIHNDGTEYQRFLFENRIREITAQEAKRKNDIETKKLTERDVLTEWWLKYPATEEIKEYITITLD